MKRRILTSLAALGIAMAPAANSDTLVTRKTNAYGRPGGLIDMPTAEMAPDAQLSTTISSFAGQTRGTLSFQITPRLSGAFRYSELRNIYVPGFDVYYDRSFDLSYLLVKEGQYWPAVKIGLQDLVGTGIYGGEFIAATKGFAGGRLRVTGGLGWGRLGSRNPIGSTGDRPTGFLGRGGIPSYDKWFRGDVAAFGGLSFDVTPDFAVMAEYSSDIYARETTGRGRAFTPESPWNIGATYHVAQGFDISAYYMYGSEFGLSLKFATNPKTVGNPGTDNAPLPVAVRNRADIADLGWSVDDSRRRSAGKSLTDLLELEKLKVQALRIDSQSAQVVLLNDTYDIESMAVGRTARAMTRVLPASVETFVITQTYKGIPIGSVTLKRRDIEALEHAPASAILDRAVFSGGMEQAGVLSPVEGSFPRLKWSFGPYAGLGFFDPGSPLRADVGLRLKASYNFAPGWVAEGAVSARVAGNLDGLGRGGAGATTGDVPVVRTDGARYREGHDPGIDYLTLTKYGRHGEDLYSRLTVGYLETSYAGISGEVLWKPATSRLALGIEANYVAKRDYDRLFGLQDYDTFTGHASAYYDIGHGFTGQLDVGRYLAGDYGATLSIDREFANGWIVGAFASKTNISSEAFGEGSFDKGFRISIPLSWALGTANRNTADLDVSSLTRDGAAKVEVRGRLYDEIRDAHQPEMAKSWGKFWR
ncbi:YjbH domain-containing protein [Pseudooceanicola sp. C21-150M6]|uniref:YjbH domain-containing protein n=1 Tax=Pseudooceanicola sp. C21-150M6 TaxID=3434355 RepID=UPI003D7FBCFE